MSKRKKMNFGDVKRLREATRKLPVMPQAPEAKEDRAHFLEYNIDQALAFARERPPGVVIAICDSRDPLGRAIIRGSGHTEDQIRRTEASMFGQPSLVPTFFIALPRDVAIERFAHTSPNISEAIESLPAATHRIVVAVTANGTTVAGLPVTWCARSGQSDRSSHGG